VPPGFMKLYIGLFREKYTGASIFLIIWNNLNDQFRGTYGFLCAFRAQWLIIYRSEECLK
jgi:hypothetical protein